MTTCKSQTEQRKAALVRAQWLKHVFSTTITIESSKMQRVRTVNVRIERSNLSQSTRAVAAACAQSPVLQSPNVSSFVSQNSFLAARSAESGLNANSWLTSLRRFNRQALQTSRPWNCDNTRKSIQMSASRVKSEEGKKVKQKSMPMARVDDFSLQATQLQGFARLYETLAK